MNLYKKFYLYHLIFISLQLYSSTPSPSQRHYQYIVDQYQITPQQLSDHGITSDNIDETAFGEVEIQPNYYIYCRLKNAPNVTIQIYKDKTISKVVNSPPPPSSLSSSSNSSRTSSVQSIQSPPSISPSEYAYKRLRADIPEKYLTRRGIFRDNIKSYTGSTEDGNKHDITLENGNRMNIDSSKLWSCPRYRKRVIKNICIGTGIAIGILSIYLGTRASNKKSTKNS